MTHFVERAWGPPAPSRKFAHAPFRALLLEKSLLVPVLRLGPQTFFASLALTCKRPEPSGRDRVRLHPDPRIHLLPVPDLHNLLRQDDSASNSTNKQVAARSQIGRKVHLGVSHVNMAWNETNRLIIVGSHPPPSCRPPGGRTLRCTGGDSACWSQRRPASERSDP